LLLDDPVAVLYEVVGMIEEVEGLHRLMHAVLIGSLHEVRIPAISSELNSKKKSDQQDEMPYKDWTASEPSNPGILFTIFPVD